MNADDDDDDEWVLDPRTTDSSSDNTPPYDPIGSKYLFHPFVYAASARR